MIRGYWRMIHSRTPSSMRSSSQSLPSTNSARCARTKRGMTFSCNPKISRSTTKTNVTFSQKILTRRPIRLTLITTLKPQQLTLMKWMRWKSKRTWAWAWLLVLSRLQCRRRSERRKRVICRGKLIVVLLLERSLVGSQTSRKTESSSMRIY